MRPACFQPPDGSTVTVSLVGGHEVVFEGVHRVRTDSHGLVTILEGDRPVKHTFVMANIVHWSVDRGYRGEVGVDWDWGDQ